MLGWHPQPDCFHAKVRIASADKGLLIRRALTVTSCWRWRPPLCGSNGLASSCAPPSTPPDLRLTASRQRVQIRTSWPQSKQRICSEQMSAGPVPLRLRRGCCPRPSIGCWRLEQHHPDQWCDL